VARSGKKFVVMHDGKAQKEYHSIAKETPVFSPDSQHMAYKAQEGIKWIVVRDGKEEERFDNVSVPEYSPDSKHLAYVAQNGKKQQVVFDGKKHKAYDGIPLKHNLVFSPDRSISPTPS
jgi:hypothetical protein